MKEVLTQLEEIRTKLLGIEERISGIAKVESYEDLSKAISLVEQSLMEARKLEIVILNKKIAILEATAKLKVAEAGLEPARD